MHRCMSQWIRCHGKFAWTGSGCLAWATRRKMAFQEASVWGVGASCKGLNSADVFDDPLTVKPDIDGPLEHIFVEDTSFPEVNNRHLVDSDWHLLWNTKIHHKEPVHLIEARSVLAAVKHRARDSTRHGRRILVFNDNMGVVLSHSKREGVATMDCLDSFVRYLHIAWPVDFV